MPYEIEKARVPAGKTTSFKLKAQSLKPKTQSVTGLLNSRGSVVIIQGTLREFQILRR